MLRGVKEGCYVVVTAFGEGVIGRTTNVCKRVYSVLASGSLAGLHRVDRASAPASTTKASPSIRYCAAAARGSGV